MFLPLCKKFFYIKNAKRLELHVKATFPLDSLPRKQTADAAQDIHSTY